MQPSLLEKLVSKPYSSIAVQSFINELGKTEKDTELGAPTDIYYNFPDSGVSMVVNSGSERIGTIFLYAEGTEKRPGYRGNLPKGLLFSMTRDEVRAFLRTPDRSKPSFDAWEEGEYKIRVEYNNNNSIKLVLLTGM